MATPADNLDTCAIALGSISSAMGTVASGLSGISSITGLLQSITTNTQDTTSCLLQIAPMIGIVNRSIQTVDVTLKTGFNEYVTPAKIDPIDQSPVMLA